jgi:hypothetical protein
VARGHADPNSIGGRSGRTPRRAVLVIEDRRRARGREPDQVDAVPVLLKPPAHDRQPIRWEITVAVRLSGVVELNTAATWPPQTLRQYLVPPRPLHCPPVDPDASLASWRGVRS